MGNTARKWLLPMRPLLTCSTLALLLLLTMFSLCRASDVAQNGTNNIDGTFFGKVFKPDEVELENRQLTIRKGDPFAPSMRLSIGILDLANGAIPEGKTYVIDADKQRENTLVISADWQEEGGNRTFKTIAEHYRIRLSFGKEETKGLLPGTIEFSMPGSPQTAVAGSFVAKVTGFRIIDRKVDLTSDSHATLNEVALEYLRKKYPGREVSITGQRDALLAATPALKKWGYTDTAVAVAGKWAGRRKLQFTKQSGTWEVFSELAPEQFQPAHPVYPPDESEHSEMVTLVAAQKAERDFLTSFPGIEVHGVDANCIYYDPEGFAGASVKYQVEGSSGIQERQYILHLTDRRWEVIRELGAQQRIDQEIKKEMTDQLLGRKCDNCRIKGALVFDGKVITTVTSVKPKFWFRNEQKNIEVIPSLEYQKGRFTISELPLGDYGMSVDVDANTENPITYPGDYQAFVHFKVVEGENFIPDVTLSKVIHLTAPQDNGRLMEHFGEECNGNISFPSPVGFSWDPLSDGVSYDYEVTRVDCKSYQPLATMAKGTARETLLTVQLPRSTPQEFYLFTLYARKQDTYIGLLTTHGDNGYGWDYRFRVR